MESKNQVGASSLLVFALAEQPTKLMKFNKVSCNAQRALLRGGLAHHTSSAIVQALHPEGRLNI
jgi:hypothetical protein